MKTTIALAITTLSLVAAACAGGGSDEGAPVFVVSQPPDHDELIAFADHLAAEGAIVYNASYSTFDDGVTYPLPYVELACAVADARARAAGDGGDPTRITLLGHSTSAYVASVAALGGTALGDAPCPAPELPEAFVGIAGWYDVDGYVPTAFPEDDWLAGKRAFFGGDVVAGARPETHLGDGTSLDVLLIHGADDTQVLPGESTRLASLLEAAGSTVAVELVADGDHDSVLVPEEDGAAVAEAVLIFSR